MIEVGNLFSSISVIGSIQFQRLKYKDIVSRIESLITEF